MPVTEMKICYGNDKCVCVYLTITTTGHKNISVLSYKKVQRNFLREATLEIKLKIFQCPAVSVSTCRCQTSFGNVGMCCATLFCVFSLPEIKVLSVDCHYLPPAGRGTQPRKLGLYSSYCFY